MGAELTIINDGLNNFEIIKANIFTPGQGICLQRLTPGNSRIIKFDHSLAYGSWYDIQIIGKNSGDNELQRFLKRGIYLSYKKTINMRELTHQNNRDLAVEWICGNCDKANFNNVAMCEHCHTNKSQTIITTLSTIPLLGIPFSLADTILRCGKASQSNKTMDQLEAILTMLFCLIDVVTAPFIVGSLMRTATKIATDNGIKLSIKNVFSDVGISLLQAITNELVKDGIPAGLKVTKAGVRQFMSTDN